MRTTGMGRRQERVRGGVAYKISATKGLQKFSHQSSMVVGGCKAATTPAATASPGKLVVRYYHLNIYALIAKVLFCI